MKYILLATVILITAYPALAQKHEFNPIKIPEGTTFTATDDTYSAFGTLDVKALQKFPVDLEACRTTNTTLRGDKVLLVLKLDLKDDSIRATKIENFLMKGVFGLVIVGVLVGVGYKLVK